MDVFITRKYDEYSIKNCFVIVRITLYEVYGPPRAGTSHGYYQNWAKIELFKIVSMSLLSASFITIQSEMKSQLARQYFLIYMSMGAWKGR